ncbi:hypothetical protein [Deinococcus misasensis]|uniref:hypothetical protein n=1 Tax=Deinococcus misasensis TaxID=392413 RepID=UPI000550C87B|nr:hypothetical protein [Deinococcus misasensis]
MQKLKFLALASVLLAACSQQSPQTQTSQPIQGQALQCGQSTIQWAGRTWTVKDSQGSEVGPGPNVFTPQNICVDDVTGQLVMRLDPSAGVWESAEIKTQQTLGTGTYTWNMVGDFSTIDRQVVLGLFPYSTIAPAGRPDSDGYKEMDIEFARWGNDSNGPVNYTVYPGTVEGRNLLINSGYSPYTAEGQSFHQKFSQSLGGTYTTHRITRTANYVLMEGFHGHTTQLSNRFRCTRFQVYNTGNQTLLETTNRTNAGAISTSTQSIAGWYDASHFISAESMPLHMNLWLFRADNPANFQPVEFRFNNFTFTSTPQVSSC